MGLPLGRIFGTADGPAVLKECAPCAFRDEAQLASSKFATAQLVCQHLEEAARSSAGISLTISSIWFCCLSVKPSN